MRALADPVAVQIGPGAHLVAIATGVKWLAVQRYSTTFAGLAFPAGIVSYFPDEGPCVTECLLALHTHVKLRQSLVMQGNSSIVLYNLLPNFL